MIMDTEFHGREYSDELRAEIQRKYPEHVIEFVGHHGLVTADFRTDRIRVLFDADRRVCEPLSEG